MANVKVRLSKRYGFREGDAREATYYGPGEVEIPQEMADNLSANGVSFEVLEAAPAKIAGKKVAAKTEDDGGDAGK